MRNVINAQAKRIIGCQLRSIFVLHRYALTFFICLVVDFDMFSNRNDPVFFRVGSSIVCQHVNLTFGTTRHVCHAPGPESRTNGICHISPWKNDLRNLFLYFSLSPYDLNTNGKNYRRKRIGGHGFTVNTNIFVMHIHLMIATLIGHV
jgi:hypothetical protein